MNLLRLGVGVLAGVSLGRVLPPHPLHSATSFLVNPVHRIKAQTFLPLRTPPHRTSAAVDDKSAAQCDSAGTATTNMTPRAHTEHCHYARAINQCALDARGSYPEALGRCTGLLCVVGVDVKCMLGDAVPSAKMAALFSPAGTCARYSQ